MEITSKVYLSLYLVNYDEAMRRQTMYKTEEGRAKLKFEEGNTHKHGGCGCGGDK